VTPFCLGIVAGAVLVAVVVTVGSYVACELMDGRSDVSF
jgi:ABC-type spermidine/putrescine transport system permease subunit I